MKLKGASVSEKKKTNTKEEQSCSSISENCLSVPCCSQNFSIWTTDVLPYLAIKRDSFVLGFFWSSSSLHQIQQQPEPTIHVDAFLYDEDFIDSLCDEGRMSRNYCTVCGSRQTAPLGRRSSTQTWRLCIYFFLHVMRTNSWPSRSVFFEKKRPTLPHSHYQLLRLGRPKNNIVQGSWAT